MNSQRYFTLALVLSLVASQGRFAESLLTATALALPAEQAAGSAAGDNAKCPLQPADLDKLTPFRWQVDQYRADRGYIPSPLIRIDYCQLTGLDDKKQMRTYATVNIARGAHAEAFAKHWHAACSSSIMSEARGKVQPVPGVPGGHQCVTAKGTSSAYWVEVPGRTIQIEPGNDAVAWAKIFPQLLALAAR